MDCKGFLTPILRTWVQKSTLLLQNRGHADVFKKDPMFHEIRNAGAHPLCTRNYSKKDLCVLGGDFEDVGVKMMSRHLAGLDYVKSGTVWPI